jgi:hypothetical protein
MQSYYYVYNPNRQPPNNRHKTFEEAKIEAERLSLKHGCEIQILKCVAVSNVSAVSTTMTSDVITNENGQEVAVIHYYQEPQYRILEVGEKINVGDEYCAGSNIWLQTRSIGGFVDEEDNGDYRRPITPNNQ